MEFSISEPQSQFTNHINIPNNDRIILSGRFGTGKTYFLKKYFNDNDDYIPIFLYPINYSVASNKDIFELIKYDILFELLSFDLDYDKIEISHIESFLDFCKQNGHHILAPFLSLLPVIGKSIYEINEKLQKLSEEYLKKHDKAQIDDKKKIVEFLENFTHQQGCIYEEDFFTILINQLLKQLKGAENPKQLVLIIDDLDRLDPEHLFRILNVFSSHLDQYDGEKKFDFDKTVIACDILNIKTIYQHRYGHSSDFDGYIDKFYSHSVYDFDNSDSLSDNVLDIMQSIKMIDCRDNDFDFSKTDNVIIKNVTYIITAMIRSKAITTRKLTKYIDKEYKCPNYLLILNRGAHINNSTIDLLNIIDFLFWLFNDTQNLLEAIKTCRDFNTDYFHDGLKDAFFNVALTILDYKQHQFTIKSNSESYVYIDRENKFSMEYLIESCGNNASRKKFSRIINTTHLENSTKKIIVSKELNYFDFLQKTINVLIEHQITPYLK